jgi:hypothetical protein
MLNPMKNNKLKITVFLAILPSLFLVSNLALASQVTGTLTTGLNATLGTTVNGVVIAPPLPNPDAGNYTSTQSVTLTADGSSGIYYTTDGITVPTCSTGTAYSGPISVGSSMTIEAISCYSSGQSSTVAAYSYTITPVITSNVVSGGNGGGGGGGGYYIPSITTSNNGQVLGASTVNTAALLQELQNLEQQLITLEFKANSCSLAFNTNLSKGMTSSEVQNLQKVLNYSSLTQVAATGAGSPNNETTYFGDATKNAVIAFQNIFANQILAPNGLTSGNGYVGASTRSVLNGLCSQ